MSQKLGKLLVFAGPSGTGKGTVEEAVMKHFRDIKFSISVTTRPRRDYEEEGVHYYFVKRETFMKKVRNNEFVEWEEVYTQNGHLYGTLRSTIDEALESGKVLLLDIDIKGGLNVKKSYPDDSISIFIQPPSLEDLRQRLINRGTDSQEQIEIRLARATEEMELGQRFDYQIVNDELPRAVGEVIDIIERNVYVNKGADTWD